MTTTIEIVNEGPAIVRTSYWCTPHARRGLLYLSINAATIRVLVPPASYPLLAPSELPSIGTPAELTGSTWRGRETYVITWLDDPSDPYVVEIDRAQCDRPIRPDDPEVAGRVLPLVWYSQIGAHAVREARRELIQVGTLVAS